MAIGGQPTKVKAGDVVRLKSGGAVMVVKQVIDHVQRPFSACAWMDARETLHHAFLDLDALEPAGPDASSPEGPHCPEARMTGGGNNNSSNSIGKGR
jgi:uncharacterized protein YodC (DUF2158 family)